MSKHGNRIFNGTTLENIVTQIKHYYFVIVLLIFSIAVCMEQPNQKVQQALKLKIDLWKQVERHAGHVVAYKTNSRGHETHSINGDDSISYGYIKSECIEWGEGFGYEMNLLVKKGCYSSNFALTNFYITKSSLCIRYATFKEINQIRQAIQTNRAEFDNMDYQNTFFKMKTDSILDRHEKRMKEKRKEFHNILPSLHWLRLGNKDQNSSFSRLSKDLIRIITKFVIDAHEQDW